MNITEKVDFYEWVILILFIGSIYLHWLIFSQNRKINQLNELIALYRENTELGRKEEVLYKKIRMRIEETNKSLEKSFKESKRIKLGENEAGNLILEFYDKDQNKKIFLFENGLIRE